MGFDRVQARSRSGRLSPVLLHLRGALLGLSSLAALIVLWTCLCQAMLRAALHLRSRPLRRRLLLSQPRLLLLPDVQTP